MPKIRAENRVELGRKRVVMAKRGGVYPVVRLLTEILKGHAETADRQGGVNPPQPSRRHVRLS
jgi:hypothetical protein